MSCLDMYSGESGVTASTHSQLGTRVGWVASRHDASAALAMGKSRSPCTGGLVGHGPV